MTGVEGQYAAGEYVQDPPSRVTVTPSIIFVDSVNAYTTKFFIVAVVVAAPRDGLGVTAEKDMVFSCDGSVPATSSLLHEGSIAAATAADRNTNREIIKIFF